MDNSEILIYQNPEGKIKIDFRLEEETVWLTQAQMATLLEKGEQPLRNTFRMFLMRAN
jgi:hypothetical protein